jgi:hypothetical protein
MSNFFLGLAGAALGSAFGMPAVGFAVGSGLGAAFSHHSPSHPASRPPLHDLHVQTQREGIGIPRVWGLVRLAGNILWASDVVESQGAYIEPKLMLSYGRSTTAIMTCIIP